jgi:hypothetical protein
MSVCVGAARARESAVRQSATDDMDAVVGGNNTNDDDDDDEEVEV